MRLCLWVRLVTAVQKYILRVERDYLKRDGRKVAPKASSWSRNKWFGFAVHKFKAFLIMAVKGKEPDPLRKAATG